MTITGEDATTRATGPASDPRGRAVTLESTLVSYDDGADRRTVYPPGLSSVARMSTWLTADSEAFVDLEGAR